VVVAWYRRAQAAVSSRSERRAARRCRQSPSTTPGNESRHTRRSARREVINYVINGPPKVSRRSAGSSKDDATDADTPATRHQETDGMSFLADLERDCVEVRELLKCSATTRWTPICSSSYLRSPRSDLVGQGGIRRGFHTLLDGSSRTHLIGHAEAVGIGRRAIRLRCSPLPSSGSC